MKKLMMMLFAATFTFATAQAQDGRKEMKHKNPEEKAQMMTDRMQKNLNLTDDQVARVNEIHLETAKKMADVKARKGDDREAMKTDMKAIKEVKSQRIKEVLTAEQYQKHQELQKERAENRKERYGNKKGKGHSKHHEKKSDK